MTGASAGIGSGFAKQAAEFGMKLVLADIAENKLNALADELRSAGAKVEAVRTDVSDPTSVDAVAARAYERFGTVDMLINNAGIMAMGFSWEVPAEKWDAMLRISIVGYVNVLHEFVPRMLEQGAQAWIVQVWSIGGLFPSLIMAPYSLTKFGTLALPESLHYEMRMQKAPIQASVVLPDSVKSDFFSTAKADGTQSAADAFNDALQQRADAAAKTRC
ncbi:SDR family NAD(P)-dependent oxidoreductase [Brevibacterium aurantiacum]|uniref:SDR family NAD(P)-dependent oxidoreductase n=1 Tax=Brevibacterium aurantiacum TaxID=273384 RepID=UPI0023AF7F15|nr:SDR family NAD(P)-dependent oxidoreductase [Brevibacterium aurantiacum]